MLVRQGLQRWCHSSLLASVGVCPGLWTWRPSMGHPRGKRGTDDQMPVTLFAGDRARERKQRSGKVGDDRWGRPGPLVSDPGEREWRGRRGRLSAAIVGLGDYTFRQGCAGNCARPHRLGKGRGRVGLGHRLARATFLSPFVFLFAKSFSIFYFSFFAPIWVYMYTYTCIPP